MVQGLVYALGSLTVTSLGSHAAERYHRHMSKSRLEAFSDGVIAIIITIMVLEFRTPEGVDWHALRSLGPIFLTYALSFVYLGIYWNNHHYLIHAATRVTAPVLWAN